MPEDGYLLGIASHLTMLNNFVSIFIFLLSISFASVGGPNKTFSITTYLA